MDPQHVVAIRARLADTFAALFARAGMVELQKLGVSDPVAVFDAARPDIQERALQLADFTLGQIARTAGDRVRRTISEELGKGKDQFEIADALREAFAGMSQRQARTVMRTVTRDLYNGASLDAYEAVGITHAIAHDGFGGLSGKTDPDCVARNGKRYTLAEAREQEHSPVTHPNCTLHWTPDADTLPDDGPLPGLASLALGFDPAEPRDYHGRWRDEFNLPGFGEPVVAKGLSAVTDLWERDKPLAERAEFQTQKLSESIAGDNATVATRKEAKQDVERHLAARLANDPRWKHGRAVNPVDEGEAIHGLVEAWATTAGDHDSLSLAIQIAASRELFHSDTNPKDLAGNDHGASPADREMVGASVSRLLNQPGMEDALRAFARAQYESTQIWLQKRGIKRVILFRGLSLTSLPRTDENHIIDVTMNPLSSWTLDYDTALGFARSGNHGSAVMLMAEVPAERIFATPRTGVGCLPEWEIVLLGGLEEVQAGTALNLTQEAFLKSIGLAPR